MPQAEVIAKALGGARRSGRGWLARCPAHDDRTPSLSLADGEDGRLLVKCFGGCDARAVLTALRDASLVSASVSRLAPARPLPSLSSATWSSKAEKIFNAALVIRDTPVERYLKVRGCALPETEEIRYLPPRSGTDYPAMLARLTDAVTGQPITLHFTFLLRDGSGKAPVEKQKILLAGHRKAGGVVRLVEDMEVTLGLGIAEGIEMALAVLRSGWRPMWAAIDAGNIASFPVLSGIDSLTVFADHDRAGLDAAQKCTARWNAAGRASRIVTPQAAGADWND